MKFPFRAFSLFIVMLYSCDLTIKEPDIKPESGIIELSGEIVLMSDAINPEVDNVIASYRIELQSETESDDSVSIETFPATIDVPAGTWDILVKAFDSENNCILTGSISNIEVQSGRTTSKSCSLSPLTSRTGEARINLDWSGADQVSFSSIWATINGTAIESGKLTITGTSVIFEDELDSDRYELIFNLDDYSISRIIDVYDYLTSSAEVHLYNSDFSSVPYAPDNLTATALSSNRIELAWHDNSYNEEGFSIDRAIDGGAFTNNYVSLPSDTTSFTDTGLTPDREYSYRIRAFKDSDYSGFSNTASDKTPSTSTVNTTPPAQTEKLIFIHHSCGDNWLSSSNGDLGNTLGSNNYYVRDIYYNWDAPYNEDMGNNTDTVHWPLWFASTVIQGNGLTQSENIMNAVYGSDDKYSAYTSISDPGGENSIIMFKSCYPNAEVGDSIDDEKDIYNSLLPYFAAHQDKLFILVTPPAPQVTSSYELTRDLNQWLVDEDSGWLSGYSPSNVAVFDFYCILSETNSRHSVVVDEVIYSYAADYDGTSPYHENDDHPNGPGNWKATDEFIPLLNHFYNRWKGN